MDELLKKVAADRHKFYEELLGLARGMTDSQTPAVLFIGCCDSRVLPEAILGVGPGQVFVTRVIGNIVPPPGTADSAMMGSVLEYAINHLNIPHIVVCGHTNCGGMVALVEGIKAAHDPHLSRWIEYARPAQTSAASRGLPDEAILDAIIEENVQLQLRHLQEYQPIRRALKADSVTLHGWVYEIGTSNVRYYEPVVESFIPLSEA